MLNKAILMGRLTRDPELRYTQSGNVPVVTFTIAVDRNYGGGNGRERQTDFIDIVAWRRTAEFVSQWFSKGMLAIVVGSIQSRKWQDKNGNNRTSIEVVADDIQFGESKKSRESRGGYQSSSGYQANDYSTPDPGYGGSYNNYGSAQQQPPQPQPPQQPQPRPTPSFDMPVGESDFSEISEDDGEIPF